MGWYDCFDFTQGVFTEQEKKAKEIWRVLKHGGRFVCCSWEEQYDLRFMDEEMHKHYPDIQENSDYLKEKPIGIAYEKPEGYRTIFQSAGFRDIEVTRETMTFVSTDEEEWWRMVNYLDWDLITGKIEDGELKRLKTAILKDLQAYKREEGICFDKVVFFVSGVK